MLQGKTALVTGSTGGIGLGIARALAGQGADVMVNGFGDRNAIASLIADLVARYGIKVAYSGADMSRPAEVAGMVEACARELGAVDVLVNNAGIQHTATVEDFPPEMWEKVIGINLFEAVAAGPALALCGILPWEESGGGQGQRREFVDLCPQGQVHNLPQPLPVK